MIFIDGYIKLIKSVANKRYFGIEIGLELTHNTRRDRYSML